MVEPGITIRPAHPADISAIGEIASESWQHTFCDLLPRDFLQSITPGTQASRHKRTFARRDVHYLVACQAKSGNLIGFVSWGRGR